LIANQEIDDKAPNKSLQEKIKLKHVICVIQNNLLGSLCHCFCWLFFCKNVFGGAKKFRLQMHFA
jgi:hypothetical protein